MASVELVVCEKKPQNKQTNQQQGVCLLRP